MESWGALAREALQVWEQVGNGDAAVMVSAPGIGGGDEVDHE